MRASSSVPLLLPIHPSRGENERRGPRSVEKTRRLSGTRLEPSIGGVRTVVVGRRLRSARRAVLSTGGRPSRHEDTLPVFPPCLPRHLILLFSFTPANVTHKDASCIIPSNRPDGTRVSPGNRNASSLRGAHPPPEPPPREPDDPMVLFCVTRRRPGAGPRLRHTSRGAHHPPSCRK